MAVPGSVYSRASTAPHLMIRNGQAVLVTSAVEVLELVSDMGQAMLSLAHGQSRATDALTEAQLAVFEAIPARRRIAVGDIALAAGVSVPACLGALTALESAGLVEGDERGWLITIGEPRSTSVRAP
jgi:DNA processing protein